MSFAIKQNKRNKVQGSLETLRQYRKVHEPYKPLDESQRALKALSSLTNPTRSITRSGKIETSATTTSFEEELEKEPTNEPTLRGFVHHHESRTSLLCTNIHNHAWGFNGTI